MCLGKSLGAFFLFFHYYYNFFVSCFLSRLCFALWLKQLLESRSFMFDLEKRSEVYGGSELPGGCHMRAHNQCLRGE